MYFGIPMGKAYRSSKMNRFEMGQDNGRWCLKKVFIGKKRYRMGLKTLNIRTARTLHVTTMKESWLVAVIRLIMKVAACFQGFLCQPS